MSFFHIPDDCPKWLDHYKLLTRKQLNIPALHMMGHADFNNASDKLDNHYHCNMEFVVVLNGKQQYVVNDKHYMLYGGDIFMTYPYEHHGNGNLPQDICEFIWFQFDLSSSKNFLGLSSPHSEYLFRQLLNYQQRIKKADSQDLAILHKAFHHLSSENPQKQILGYSYFLQFVMKNLCSKDTILTKDIYSSDIQEAMSYVHSHLLDDLNIDAIAEHCGLSPSRFKAKFRKELGITPHAYIVSLKIDTAKILLKDPQNSVTDVAFQLNFSSSNHFASVFKKHTGYTPTDFRQQRLANIY
ncbi:MAG: helix-turn-helix transcriptional regulator [Clostridiales bacterium]|nr:helix-turn-helix transcriptional regulator [Clostridiales bacterium]